MRIIFSQFLISMRPSNYSKIMLKISWSMNKVKFGPFLDFVRELDREVLWLGSRQEAPLKIGSKRSCLRWESEIGLLPSCKRLTTRQAEEESFHSQEWERVHRAFFIIFTRQVGPRTQIGRRYADYF